MDWKTVITQAQARNGLTQTRLAQQVGCSQASITDLLRGRTREPRYSLGQRLLDLSNGDTQNSKHLTGKPCGTTPTPQAPTTAQETNHA